MQLTFAGDGWFAADNVDAVLADVTGWSATGLADVQLPPGDDGVLPLAATVAEQPSWFGLDSGIPMTGTTKQGLPTPENASPNSSSKPVMPPLDAALDLVDVFFERFHLNLPILHRGRLTARLRALGIEGNPPLLLLAIMTVAASGHPNPRIRANQAHWRLLARDALKRSLPTEEHPLQTLQAALLLIFDALQEGDYPVTWMMLGEAWRKAAVIGYHQVDARDSETMVQYLGSVEGLDEVQREECRRVVWTFFILDRGLCYPIGMVHAVDERRLVVNFPMSEDDFQNAEALGTDRPVLKYTNGMGRLIARVRDHGRCTLLHYIILAYVLLGRVTEEVYMQDAEEHGSAALDDLIERLLQIRLLLPGYASDLSLAEPADVPYVVWLSAVLGVSTIFLHHRAVFRSAEDNASNSGDVAAATAAKWPHAVRSARNTVQLLRDACRAGAGSSFMLAHTTAALFVSTRVLIMEYLLSEGPKRDRALRSDLEVLAAVSMQAHGSLGMLGRKLRAKTTAPRACSSDAATGPSRTMANILRFQSERTVYSAKVLYIGAADPADPAGPVHGHR